MENVLYNNKYRALEMLYTNSVLTAYLGEDTTTGMKVMIKLINPAVVTRYEIDKICFAGEAKTISSFDHPNIVKLYSYEDTPGSFCLITEYFESVLLSQHLKVGIPFDVNTALDLITQLASAVKYAHDKGILHRNLKANNICLISKGDSYSVKIFDFGMSYIIDYLSCASKNVDANFGYMAPESAGLLDRKVSQCSDLYSLGILMYQMLTGVLPFHADTIDNMVYQHVAVTPQSPELINPDIPADISNIVMKLINKDPDLRYQTANELISDIDRYKFCSMANLPSTGDNLLQNLDERSRRLSRKPELSSIRSLYSKALSARGSFCIVRGSLGCGKSDLFENLYNELEENNIPFFRTRFLSHNSMTPFCGIQDILNHYMEIYQTYDKKYQITERNRLARTLSGLTDIVFRINPDMKKVLPASFALPTLEGFKEQQRSIMMLASFLMSLYENTPFVLSFEDLHYADSASLSLLNEIADSVSNHKVFVICSYRDEELEETTSLDSFLSELKNHSVFDEISLKPLSESRMCEYLSDLLSLPKEKCRTLSAYMVEKTDGNPYFTVNLLRSMLEDGIITVYSDSLDQNWDRLRSINTEQDLTQIILRRMSQLPEDAISFFRVAAVIGAEFSMSLLLYVTDLTQEDVNDWLSQAVSMQFIYHSSTRDLMSFAHVQIHNAFLAGLSPERKAELHYHIAKAIETKNVNPDKEIYRLIYHFTQANDNTNLRKYILKAADSAKNANALEEAITYYSKAVELIEIEGKRNSAEWIDAKHALTELNITVGHYTVAISYANELLPIMTDPLEKAQLLKYIGLGYFRQSRFKECERTLLSALEQLGEHFPRTSTMLSVQTAIARVYRMLSVKKAGTDITPKAKHNKDTLKAILSIFEILGWVYAYTDQAKFRYTVLSMYAYANSELGPSKELAAAASGLSIYHTMRSERKSAENMQLLALGIRRSLKDDYGIARSLFFFGIIYMCRSEYKQSIKYLVEASESFRKIGDIWELNNLTNFLAISYCLAGEFENCQKVLLPNIERLSKLHDMHGLCLAYATLIRCYTCMGSYPNAMEAAKRSLPLFTDLDSPFALTVLNLNYGILLCETGKYEKARQYLDIAKELYEKNRFIKELTSSLYAYLAICHINILKTNRSGMAKNEISSKEIEICELTDKCIKETKGLPNQLLSAYIALAQCNITIEKFGRAEGAFKRGLEIAIAGENKYETAKLHYEYGLYLLDKHKTEAARYHIFEAYMTFSSISSLVLLKETENLISTKYKDDFSDNTLLANVADRRNRMNIDRKINTLLRLGERLTSTLELEELQHKVLQDAVELVGAERGILFLYPEVGEKHLYIASLFNLNNFDCNTYDWMLEEVEKTKQPIVINDVQSDEYRRHYTIMVRYGIKSVMAMPMFVRGKLFGVIYLDSRLTRNIFSSEYIETMGFIANQAGAPIENARLYHRAITDALTGIYGRSYLDNLIIDKTSSHDNIKLSAIMIDIDFFKKCNDTYGHPFGDKVLKQVASIMKKVVGDSGAPCRYGGEEFLILLDSDDADFAIKIAENIRTMVENTTIPFSEADKIVQVSVTISLGISIWRPGMERIDLIENADKALYFAKHNGKNQAILWDEENKKLTEGN